MSGQSIESTEETYCVVPPIRIAGCAPRKSARLERHFEVAASWVYPGNAKNSSETLNSDGSTEAAEDGGLEGMLTACDAAALRSAMKTGESIVSRPYQ